MECKIWFGDSCASHRRIFGKFAKKNWTKKAAYLLRNFNLWARTFVCQHVTQEPLNRCLLNSRMESFIVYIVYTNQSLLKSDTNNEHFPCFCAYVLRNALNIVTCISSTRQRLAKHVPKRYPVNKYKRPLLDNGFGYHGTKHVSGTMHT
jgi:hypothetical protein